MQQTPKPEAQLPAAVPLFSVHSVLVKHVPLRFVLKNLNIFYYYSMGKQLKFEPNPMTIYYTQKYEPSTKNATEMQPNGQPLKKLCENLNRSNVRIFWTLTTTLSVWWEFR